jgi:hypothetical protein
MPLFMNADDKWRASELAMLLSEQGVKAGSDTICLSDLSPDQLYSGVEINLRRFFH